MLSAVFSLVMLGAVLSARFDDAFAVDLMELILLVVLVTRWTIPLDAEGTD
jgi:hypothetical protein